METYRHERVADALQGPLCPHLPLPVKELRPPAFLHPPGFHILDLVPHLGLSDVPLLTCKSHGRFGETKTQ